jgi:RNA polymerase sigma-70 factor (ECF subfamily)
MAEDHEHDRRLAARAGAGDERAFDELVERHRAALLHYVARRLRPELAEDAVQEALLSAHRALIAGTRPADLRAWLATIAWRRALDLARRERDALPLDAGVAAKVADDPEARVLQAHELDRVVSAMSELPERQLAALKLSALEGRSLEEIGDALDVGAETAKSLVARSRRTLTHRLAAADLDCGEARLAMEAAALRGVRLSGLVTLHVEGCRTCARAHRSIRRRRRVALIIPFGLLVKTAKLRDLVAFNPAWELHASAAKMCTAACLTAVGTTSVAAPTATVAVPLVTRIATPEPKVAELVKPQRKKPRSKPKATPTATVAPPVATETPTPRPPVATATPTPKPTVAGATPPATTPPEVTTAMAGGGESAPTIVKPERTPTPEPTVVTPTPPPAETPNPTPTG